MTDQPVPPSGPIDPSNPPTKPPVKTKGRVHEQTETPQDERPDESEPTTEQAAD